MILLDFMTFMSMLLFVFIYMLSSIFPSRNIRILMQLNSIETRSQDFLNSEIWSRGLIIQLFSYFTLSITVVMLCYTDKVQQNLQIQFFTLFFEVVMFICIYIGSPWMQKFSAISYGLRMLVIIFWGSYLMLTSQYKIGEQVGNNRYLVSLYFAIFITTRELLLVPLLIFKAYFKIRYDQLAISELKRLKMALRRKFNSKPG